MPKAPELFFWAGLTLIMRHFRSSGQKDRPPWWGRKWVTGFWKVTEWLFEGAKFGQQRHGPHPVSRALPPSRTWLLSSSGAYSYETQFRSYATAQPMTAALFHELAAESEVCPSFRPFCSVVHPTPWLFGPWAGYIKELWFCTGGGQSGGPKPRGEEGPRPPLPSEPKRVQEPLTLLEPFFPSLFRVSILAPGMLTLSFIKSSRVAKGITQCESLHTTVPLHCAHL